MILIGYPIWQGDLSSKDIIDEVVKAEFNFIELSLDYPWPLKDLDRLHELVNRAKDLNLKIGVHGPWRDVSLASPIESIRRASLKIYENVFEIAGKIDALYVNVHLISRQAFHISKDIENDLVNAAMESVNRLVELSRDHGVDLIIENNASGFGGCIEHLVPIINSFKEVKVCFDVPHAVSAYAKRSRGREKINYLDLVSMWSEEFKDKLILLHLHGYRIHHKTHIDDHLPLEVCEISIKDVLKRLRNTNLRYILLEIFYNEQGNRIRPLSLVNSVREVKSWARTLLLLRKRR